MKKREDCGRGTGSLYPNYISARAVPLGAGVTHFISKRLLYKGLHTKKTHLHVRMVIMTGGIVRHFDRVRPRVVGKFGAYQPRMVDLDLL